MNRDDVLDKTKEILNGARQEAYGDAKDCFYKIAVLWATYLGRPISKIDVANMMMLLKIARQSTGEGSLDNFIDIAGYSALAGEMWETRDG